jgi:hypothetical protein
MPDELGGSRGNAITMACIKGMKKNNVAVKRPAPPQIRIDGFFQVASFHVIVRKVVRNVHRDIA